MAHSLYLGLSKPIAQPHMQAVYHGMTHRISWYLSTPCPDLYNNHTLCMLRHFWKCMDANGFLKFTSCSSDQLVTADSESGRWGNWPKKQACAERCGVMTIPLQCTVVEWMHDRLNWLRAAVRRRQGVRAVPRHAGSSLPGPLPAPTCPASF
jgi:hypothetical protein